MEFRPEDILKNIIPGLIACIGFVSVSLGNFTYSDFKGVFFTDIKDYSEIMLIFLLVFAYLMGYIVDAISSFIEYNIVYKFLGTPSSKLLTNSKSRIHLVNQEAIINNIVLKCSLKPEDFILDPLQSKKNLKSCNILFKHANYLKDENPISGIKEKVKQYYFSYIFSRNLFFSAFFSCICVLISQFNKLTFLSITLFVICLLVLYYRKREQSFYYSRQVLLASNHSTKSSD